MNSVLLSGPIDRERANIVLNDLKMTMKEGVREITLEIDSDGGETSATLDMISKINAWQEYWGVNLVVLIKNAKSSAALLALSVGSSKKIEKFAEITLHRGELHLQASDFDRETGVITNPEVMKIFDAYTAELGKVLSKYGLSQNKRIMAVLYATDWLVLTDESCLHLGIVSEIV